MKTFYQLLINTSIASILNSTVWFSIIFFAYLQTQSVITTSVMAGIYLVITAGGGFILGGLVDKYKKKKLMITSSIFSMIIYIIGLIIYSLTPIESFQDITNPTLWIFIVLLLIGTTAGNIRSIALSTLVTVLVDEKNRDKANGLVGTSFGISFLIVSVISGILVGLAGMTLALIVPIIGIIFVVIHLLTIDINEKGIVKVKDSEKPEITDVKKLDVKGTIKIIKSVPGLMSLIIFTTFNNLLGGAFMSLMDPYGLSLVSVEVWGVLWGVLSLAFIVGGTYIAKKGLGENPLKAMFDAKFIMWTASIFFTIQPSIVILFIGVFIYLAVYPFIEAAEQTILQKVVPHERQGRVFGFAQSIELAASPIIAFAIGPITQLFFEPFMTDGLGAQLIGSWYGTGPARGIALVFTIAGILGFILTFIAYRSRFYKQLSERYLDKGES